MLFPHSPAPLLMFKQESCLDFMGMRNTLLLCKAIEILGFILHNHEWVHPTPRQSDKHNHLFLILGILDQVRASKKFTQICDYQRYYLSTKRPIAFLLGTEWHIV